MGSENMVDTAVIVIMFTDTKWYMAVRLYRKYYVNNNVVE